MFVVSFLLSCAHSHKEQWRIAELVSYPDRFFSRVLGGGKGSGVAPIAVSF